MALVTASVHAETPGYITFPSDIDWVTRSTPHFHVLYRRGEDRLAERTLAAAERAHSLLSPVFQETPEVTWIVLADFHDSLNGYAIDFPFPHFVLFVSPPDAGGHLSVLDNWLDSLVLHEYTHVLHLYPAHGIWSAVRAVFGSWVLPNGMLPSHLHEGLATFMETEFSQGGRGRGPHFPMITRMAVKEGIWGREFAPSDLFEPNIRWPQGASPYYFGQQIFHSLWQKKKGPGIHAFVQKTSRTILPYWVSRSTEEVYGASYPTLWKEVFDSTQERVAKEIQAIEAQPLSHLRYLTDTRMYKWDLKLSPDGKTVAYRAGSPDKGNTLEIRSAGDLKEIQSLEIEGHQEGLCWTVHDGKAFVVFSESETENNYQFNALRVYSAQDRNLIRPRDSSNARIDHLLTVACRDNGNVLTYQENSGRGFVREWKPDADLKKWTKIHEWAVPEGEWVSSIEAGIPALIAVRRSVVTQFYEWDGTSAKRIGELPGHFYQLGRRLPSGEWTAIGTVSGREEIYAIDPRKKLAKKRVAVLGGIGSFDRHDDKWWVTSYRHGGYDLAEATPISSSTNSASHEPSLSPYAEKTPMSEARTYYGFSTLRPRAWIPSTLIVPGGMQISAWIPGFDVSQRHFYNLFGGYDTRGSAFFFGNYSYRYGLNQQLNFDFAYLPAYVISSAAFLRQWGATVGWSTRLGPELPYVSVSANFKRLEPYSTDPENQSMGVSIGISDTFWYKTVPRAIAPIRATKVAFNWSQYFKEMGSTDNYYVGTLSVDQYLAAPWGARHVFKLGLRLGDTFGTTLNNSFLQGGGELQFSSGRGFFLNRGFLPGRFLARRMFTMNLDFMFPILEIERGHNQWPFFLKRIDGALVLDTTTMSRFMYYYTSAGFELKSSWKTFFYLPTQVRFGFYHGFGQYGEPLYMMMAIEASL